MRGKVIFTAIFTAVAAMAMPFTALAGQWRIDPGGWWWQNDDGSYPTDSWQWLDGNQDGVSECYYFDSTGYLVTNTITPDNYQVNEDGAWIENGAVQTKGGEDDSPGGMWGDDLSVEVKEFAENFYIVEEPRTRGFLILGDEKALLVDTLYEEDNVLEEVRKITDLPIEVVITHGHPDHIGGIGYFTSCYINEGDAYLLPEGIQANYLKEGDIVQNGDYSFEVLELPGHSAGSIGLLDREHKILIGGDSVYPGPIIMFGDGVSMESYVNSMAKLMNYMDDIQYILPGHNDCPIGSEYIQYAYEDGMAVLNGELEGTSMQAMGGIRTLYQGDHVSFICD